MTKAYDEQAYGVFKKYPGIKIVGDFYGNWNDATSQEEIAKILAAHPNVDGIWTVDGTYGSLQAVINNRPDRLVAIAGQSNNGYRLVMADPDMQAKGLKGVSSSAGPAVGGYAFKLMMEVVTGKKKLDRQQHRISAALGRGEGRQGVQGRQLRRWLQHLPGRQGAAAVHRHRARWRASARAEPSRGPGGRRHARRHHPGAAGGEKRRRSRRHQLRQLRDGEGLA